MDMDNTMVDWDGEFILRYSAAAGRADIGTTVRNRQLFEMEENFPPCERSAVLRVVAEPGFYTSLQPLPGAVEALQAMVERGVDVRLVTAPHPTCPGSCTNEKYTFVQRHLGEVWLNRLIITRDKTLVRGDILVDDKPVVTGSIASPSWTHVIFDQPYNRTVASAPRLCQWAEWEVVFANTLQKTSKAANGGA